MLHFVPHFFFQIYVCKCYITFGLTAFNVNCLILAHFHHVIEERCLGKESMSVILLVAGQLAEKANHVVMIRAR